MDDKEQADDMPALIERIENRVGMGCGAWDMVNAADLVRAVIAESSSHREAEVKALREALHAAATSLETLSKLSGRETYGNPPIETCMGTFMDVRLYAAARARAAREEMAAAAMKE